MNWKDLQNGSDIRGVALPGVAGEPVNLTTETAAQLGTAFAAWLSNRTGKPPPALRIAVGRDSRLSGPALLSSLVSGLTQTGCSVADCGLASTPAMFMTTVTPGYGFDGAVMLTASHLPFNRNGMKFFTARGGFEKEDITDLLKRAAESASIPRSATPGAVTPLDFTSVYAHQFVQQVRREVANPSHPDQPLRGLRIVVDAGNGAGGFYVSHVLQPLGADTTGSQYLEPDGTFPNHVPNPEAQEAMDALCLAVRESQADLGIIFDTDVDRAAAVDSTGKQINRNRLVALASAIVLEEHPGSTIVTDSITSDGLTAFIRGLGGKHHRFKRGYRNVINESLRLNSCGEDSWLAIETSGHAAMRENFFLDDGAYLITKIVIKLAQLRKEGRTLFDLIGALPEPAESRELRIVIRDPDYKACGNRVIRELEEFARRQPGWSVAPDNYEGVRVSCGSGWFLLRLSLHDPVMPLNIESDLPGGVASIAGTLLPFLGTREGLEVAKLPA